MTLIHPMFDGFRRGPHRLDRPCAAGSAPVEAPPAVDRAMCGVVAHAPVQDFTPALIAHALSGDPRHLRGLIDKLQPVVQSRVARVLLRNAAMRMRGMRIQQEVEDLTQDVFERLFANGGAILRGWQPDRGLSFLPFVGMVSERATISMLRSRPRNPLSEAPTEAHELELRAETTPGPERAIVAQQLTRTLVARLEIALSPLGFKVFQALYCDDKNAELVSEELGITVDAVYTWRHRIKKAVLEVTADLRDGTTPRSQVR